jgi:hypothetical protein
MMIMTMTTAVYHPVPPTTTNDTPPAPSLTSNCSWGGWQVERQRIDGDGGEGHNSNDEGKRETAQRGNDDE